MKVQKNFTKKFAPILTVFLLLPINIYAVDSRTQKENIFQRYLINPLSEIFLPFFLPSDDQAAAVYNVIVNKSETDTSTPTNSAPPAQIDGPLTVLSSGMSKDEVFSYINSLFSTLPSPTSIQNITNTYVRGGGTEGVADAVGRTTTSLQNSINGLLTNPSISGTLSGTDGIFSGDLSVGDDLTVTGDLNVTGAQTLSGALGASYFNATNAAATTTLAGGLAIETSGLVYDFSSNKVGIGTASPTAKLDIKSNSTSASNNALYIQDSAGSPIMLIRDDGRVAFGISDPSIMNEEFEIRRTRTSATGNTYGFRTLFGLDMATNDYQWASALNEIVIPAGNSSNFTNLVRANYNYLRHDGTGTLTKGIGSVATSRFTSSGITTEMSSFEDSVALSNTAQIGTLYHNKITPAVINDTSSVGTEYGLYIGNITAPTVEANRYAIYTLGSTNKVYFGGPTSVASSFTLLGGTQSASAWGTGGIQFQGMNRSFTDTSSSGTVAAQATYSFMRPTILASNATTYTNSATVYIENAPLASTNVTQTNPWALYVASGNSRFGNVTVAGTASLGGAVDFSTSITANGSAQYIGAGGSASVPDFALVNTNMGMFRAANNQMGFSTLGVERMRIDASGNIGIGTTSPWTKFGVNGTVAMPALPNDSTGYFVCLNTTTGQLATSTGVCGASSIKYKENVAPLSYGLNEILSLDPVFFDYKDSYIKNAPRQIGFIAEEVDPINPEVVSRDQNREIQGLDYPKFTAVLVKAIQELNKKFDDIMGAVTETFDKYLASHEVYIRDATVGNLDVQGDTNFGGKICVDDTCLTKEQFKEMMLRSGVGATQVVSGGTENNNSDSAITADNASTTIPETATTTPIIEEQNTASTTLVSDDTEENNSVTSTDSTTE